VAHKHALANKKTNEFYYAAHDDNDGECHDHAMKARVRVLHAQVVHRSLAR